MEWLTRFWVASRERTGHSAGRAFGEFLVGVTRTDPLLLLAGPSACGGGGSSAAPSGPAPQPPTIRPVVQAVETDTTTDRKLPRKQPYATV